MNTYQVLIPVLNQLTHLFAINPPVYDMLLLEQRLLSKSLFETPLIEKSRDCAERLWQYKVFSIEKLFERKHNNQNLGYDEITGTRHEISRKFLPIRPNLRTNCHLKHKP